MAYGYESFFLPSDPREVETVIAAAEPPGGAMLLLPTTDSSSSMVSKRAKVHWITQSQGGRTKPPLGEGDPPYSTVVRYVNEPWPSDEVTWSLVVRKKVALSSEREWIAEVHYLVEAAPVEMLSEGREFELYEGRKRVATDKIIG